VLFLTNLWTLPLTALTMLALGEARAVAAFPRLLEPGLVAALAASALLAGALNYLVFLSASVNSPLTTSVIGAALSRTRTPPRPRPLGTRAWRGLRAPSGAAARRAAHAPRARAGQAKNVVGSLGGFLLFPPPGGAEPAHVAGCTVGLVASLWYAAAL
jgi:hypothetical protein